MMLFIGYAPPYYITQPSTDDYIQIVSPSTTMTTVMCSINVTITNDIIPYISNNEGFLVHNRSGNTISATIRDLQPSDLGPYKCGFIDAINGWTVTRTILLGM